MVQVSWTMCVLSVSAVLELLLGGSGVLLPLVCLAVFHLSVLRHWGLALLLGWLGGMWVDMVYCRPFPVHLLLVPLMVGLGRIWRSCQMTHSLLVQCLPGLACGTATGMLLLLFRGTAFPYGWAGWGYRLRFVALCGVWSMVVYPVQCVLLEAVAERLGLRRYSRVGAEYLSGAEQVELMGGEDEHEEF